MSAQKSIFVDIHNNRLILRNNANHINLHITFFIFKEFASPNNHLCRSENMAYANLSIRTFL